MELLDFPEVMAESYLYPARYKKLLTSFQNHRKIPHAILFVGKAGFGTLFTAWGLSQAIMGEYDTEKAVFMNPKAALKVYRGQHPDIIFVYPTASNRKGQSKDLSSFDFSAAWRSFLREKTFFDAEYWFEHIELKESSPAIRIKDIENIVRFVSTTPVEASKKIVFIYLPEYMSAVCGNKLLKTLEEPPDHVIFIAVAQNTKNILPTFLSRFQSHTLSPYPGQVVDMFLEKSRVQKCDMVFFASQAQGNLAKAIDCIEKKKDFQFEEVFIVWMRLCYKADILIISQWSQKTNEMGKLYTITFLEYSLEILREIFLLHYEGSLVKSKESIKSKFDLDKLKDFVHQDNFESIYEIITQSIKEMSRNANIEMTLMKLSINMARLIHNKN